MLLGSGVCLAQSAHSKNNPYSPSPSGHNAAVATVPKVKSNPDQAVFIMQPATRNAVDAQPSTVQQSYRFVKAADTRVAAPTEVYRVGIGDVLYVNLKNAPRASGYLTVRDDGTIDFPLAGDGLIVAGQPADAIEQMLVSRITLYPDPQVEVKVREYGSHKITVSGLVDYAGEKSLQREAIPLYVIKAMAVVRPLAAKAVITREAGQKPDTYDLRNVNTDNVLIYPGNSIEFAGPERAPGVYFISGDIASPGQKELTAGLTLYQAITSAGEGSHKLKKAVIRRKTDSGTLTAYTHNLRDIKDGKAADPALQQGDIIEVKK
jgi:protein involved in polysaccharide export with SLBB domain